ncbi:hypothetical protein, partial [Marichromatium bheemlicum]|uniref:hypothetical protein n=1 Tax=Marichromatium bheemlicum TaxID=365339 RepID=UPI001B2FF904
GLRSIPAPAPIAVPQQTLTLVKAGNPNDGAVSRTSTASHIQNPSRPSRLCGSIFWPLAAGRWPLAAGRWPLAAGRWPLAARYPRHAIGLGFKHNDQSSVPRGLTLSCSSCVG